MQTRTALVAAAVLALAVIGAVQAADPHQISVKNSGGTHHNVNPFQGLSAFDHFGLFDDDWMFPSFAPLSRASKPATDASIPLRVDFKEEANRFVFHADLPGVPKEDVQVSINENTLTISAERKREEVKDTEKFHRVERQFGKVYRSFRLPETANVHAVGAKYENGVLSVTVDKLAPEQLSPKSRNIPIA